MANFNKGDAAIDWHKATTAFVVPEGKTVSGMTLYTMYRNVANGGDLNEADTGLIKLQHSIVISGQQSTNGVSGSQFAVVCGVENEILPPVTQNPNSLVDNGSFEGDPTLDWTAYSNGFTMETSEKHSGSQSIRVANGGAKQTVVLNAPKGSAITISGYSKAIGVTPNLGSHYSIYADVKYSDGAYLWGQRAEFAGGTSAEWELASHTFRALKEIESLSFYALYRNDPANGVAYFDDIEVLTTPPLVANGGFEGADVADSWSAFGSAGYSVSGYEAYEGSQSVVVTNGAALQEITVNAGPGSAVTLSGCSKAVGTSVDLWDYAIYADVTYSDGTHLWGQKASFSGGTTAWVCSSKSFTVPIGKTVVALSLYTLYRNDPLSGTAYFDNVEVVVS